MKILIVGGGGREHALAWKLSQSPRVKEIFISPGNAGTSSIGTNVLLDLQDHQKLIDWIHENQIELVVVGPDDPLADGLVDSMLGAGIPTFGPQKAAAEIEWSKAFAKSFMREEGVPTADFESFTDFATARDYLRGQKFPMVIKADGLARGKGVIIAKNFEEGEQALADMLSKKVFGAAGNTVVIEEFLDGHEISVHAFCDGETAVLFPPSQDHKRIGEGDTGPNTGGMGTIAPVPWVSEDLMDEIRDKIILPTLRGLKKRGREFVGILYPGLMITKDGPKVLEFNARFGDPETQSYMRLLKTDLADIILACIQHRLHSVPIEWEKHYACCVVLASAGYPGEYVKDIPISGLDEAESPNTILFHAGTKQDGPNIVTNGGRVLGATAVGEMLNGALDAAYQSVSEIHFAGMQYRKDIGQKSLYARTA
ncbi:MAG: phosphoribosylamine--glycine ligase [Candidatus Sungbacteria bacterium]|uniref:Phosphoribosylamine--glycine ligase n=1 Tax=Candidatus Sungiibacteriota bacterium TaxID=2750080 RepID=A0A931WNN5_9BACT|nr:phosphoribosylamine--glycine ligase [Candidatus Sungbacteria bacterium]